MFYVLGNWKSFKSLSQARQWYDAFTEALAPDTKKAMQQGALTVAILPPAPLLYALHTLSLQQDGIVVGAQDVSPLPEAKETGLINASSLAGIARYVIVGHMEQRRRGDGQAVVVQKYTQVKEQGIEPILCISNATEYIEGASFIAYEPIAAVGTGNNMDVSEVLAFKHALPQTPPHFLYGGSVSPENAAGYLETGEIHGFLVGAVSLDALRFASLINRCATYAKP